MRRGWSCRSRHAGDQHARSAIDAAAQHRVEAGRRRSRPRSLGDLVVRGRADVQRHDRDALSSMRNGYSFVPWAEPRYLTIRSRRVVTWSCTRLSSRITQSETYSSSPCRVRVPSPRSPVMIAVTPRSLSQPNRRRSSARRIDRSTGRKQRLHRVEHDALGADLVDGIAETDEQAFEVVVAGLLDFAAFDADVIDHHFLSRRSTPRRRNPVRRRCRPAPAQSPRS